MWGQVRHALTKEYLSTASYQKKKVFYAKACSLEHIAYKETHIKDTPT